MRSLTDAELEAYDHIPMAVAARVRLLRVPVLPNGADGMTVDRFILLKRDDPADQMGERELLAHELVHVVQFGELGLVGFGRRYVAAYLKNLHRLRRHRPSYLAIPYEEEAREAAARWAASRG